MKSSMAHARSLARAGRAAASRCAPVVTQLRSCSSSWGGSDTSGAGGERFRGYVTFYHPTNNFGFVVREDKPDKEFYFTSGDIHTQGLPKARPFQQVEFTGLETGYGRFVARDLTAFNGQPLEFSHSNLKIPRAERVLKMSQSSHPEERQKGVVVWVGENGDGYIAPDKLEHANIVYAAADIQAVGRKRLKIYSEVEFNVRATRRSDGSDRAFKISRPGGGLVCDENREVGSNRRQLGMMYSDDDVIARIPQTYAENRSQGYVVEYNQDRLFGFAVTNEDPSERMFFHMDDCHIQGPRQMRINESVEFFVEDDPSYLYKKALHVCAPHSGILRFPHKNQLLAPEDRQEPLQFDEGQTFTGVIEGVYREQQDYRQLWGFIVPDDVGKRTVYFNRTSLAVTDQRNIQEDTRVQFKLERRENSDDLRAVDVRAPNGKPLTTTRGVLGDWYRQRGIKYSGDLPEAQETGDEFVEGIICQWNRTNGWGLADLFVEPAVQRVVIHCSDFEFDPKYEGTNARTASHVQLRVEKREVENEWEGRMVGRNVRTAGAETYNGRLYGDAEAPTTHESKRAGKLY